MNWVERNLVMISGQYKENDTTRYIGLSRGRAWVKFAGVYGTSARDLRLVYLIFYLLAFWLKRIRFDSFNTWVLNLILDVFSRLSPQMQISLILDNQQQPVTKVNNFDECGSKYAHFPQKSTIKRSISHS